MKYIPIIDIASELDLKQAQSHRDCSMFLRAIRRHFPNVLRQIKFPGRVGAEFLWAIPQSKKKTVLRRLGYLGRNTEIIPHRSPARPTHEHDYADKLRKQGWIVIVTDDPGTFDIIGFKKRRGGGFDVLLREIKSSNDRATKEQVILIDKMKELGMDASFDWIKP